MELRRTSARRAGLVAVAALLALGATACSGGTGLVGTPPAATVNGATISQNDVDQAVQGSKAAVETQIANLRKQYAGDDASLQQIEAEIPSFRAPYARTEYTYPTSGAAKALTDLINSQLYVQAVDYLGGRITDADRETAKQQLDQDTTYQGSGKAIRASLREGTAAQVALRRRLPKDLIDLLDQKQGADESRLRTIFERDKATFEPDVCAYVVQAADQNAMNAALTRIVGGESPSAVAGDVTGPGAEQAQCNPMSTITQSFGQSVSTAKGAILGPISTGSGFVFLVVDHVEAATFEDVRQQVLQTALNEWLDDLFTEFADVHVDPRFGTWNASTRTVVPPVAPKATAATGS